MTLPLMLLLALADAHDPLRIVLVGDSTVNDQGGWGPGLRAAFDGQVEVLNHALNGRSSKSFRDEGKWQPALAARPDIVLIQFGHNDVPGKGPERETVAGGSYRDNLARYVAEATQAGATVVLVTSIVRRAFTPEGRFAPDNLVPYVEEVRRLAAEKGVRLLDLYTLTKEQAEKAGPVGAREIGLLDANGKQDNTHLGPLGQASIGRMAAEELVKLIPSLRPRLKPTQ